MTSMFDDVPPERTPEQEAVTAAVQQAGPGARHAELPEGNPWHAVFTPDRVVLVHTRPGRNPEMMVMSSSDWDSLARWAPKMRGLAR